jgi:hypothetical protein
MEHMAMSMKNQRQRAAVKPPPDDFWKLWKSQMNSSYPRGIDRAKGVTSTRYNPDKAVVLYDQTYVDRLRASTKFRKGELKMGLLKSAEEAFVHHRVENMVKNERKKIEQQKAQAQEQLAAAQQDAVSDSTLSGKAGNMKMPLSLSLSATGSLSSDPFRDMSVATKDGFAHFFGFKQEDSSKSNKSSKSSKGSGKSQRALSGKSDSSKSASDRAGSSSSNIVHSNSQGNLERINQQQYFPANGNAAGVYHSKGAISATSSLTSLGASATSHSSSFPKGRSRVSFM